MFRYYLYYRRRLERIIFTVVPKPLRVWILRKHGVKIGENCHISNIWYSTEPYLIEIGNHVAIAPRTELITHDGGVWIFRNNGFPNIDVFGKIIIGDNTFIGSGCTILPNTTIGNNCVIGSGSVVRGRIPDNSIVIGNPAKVIMKTSIYKKLVEFNHGRINSLNFTTSQKKAAILELFSK